MKTDNVSSGEEEEAEEGSQENAIDEKSAASARHINDSIVMDTSSLTKERRCLDEPDQISEDKLIALNTSFM